MNNESPQDDGRIVRRTLPTAAFTLTVQIISWIEEESKRRGVSKSVLVREILDSARTEAVAA
jgi:hypothetical protein